MRKLMVGKSDFRQVMEGGYYYVDKTLLVREILDGGEVTLATRPRRFGKTLNLSMLYYFFSDREDGAHLFSGLAIAHAGPEYMQHQGQYPVIYLSLKDVKGPDWESAWDALRQALARTVLDLDLHQWDGLDLLERQTIGRLLDPAARPAAATGLLGSLTSALHRRSGRRAIVLVDEYDTPFLSAWLGGYYPQMADVLRNLLGGLKDNPDLARGVLTGITRIARESIFSGLNNLRVCSVLDPDLAPYFGFTEAETAQLLHDMGASPEALHQVRQWYNGYSFAGHILYNPWSVVNFAAAPDLAPKPYWVESSSNELLKRLFFGHGAHIRNDLASLIQGGSVRKRMMENLIFSELDHNPDAVWALLAYAGYLNASDPLQDPESLGSAYCLSIPNLEIRSVFLTKIRTWLQERAGSSTLEYMLEALAAGDAPALEDQLSRLALGVFSFYDTAGDEPEAFYHAFLLGLLTHLSHRYEIRSNRESGYGRFDIALFPRQEGLPGIILELKSPNLRRGEQIGQALDAALEQLRSKRYDTELLERGAARVIRLAIAVKGKEVLVAQAPPTA